jgi:Double zinc ribbon
MQLTSVGHTRFSDEMSIVPGWAWGLAAAAFVLAQFLVHVVVARQPNATPLWGRFLMGILVGVVLGCYLLLLGYVNRDARRRGMSWILWTAVAILVPNGLGFVLYFILRQPILAVCPSCGGPVMNGFNFCPRCSSRLSPSCPQCQHMVRPEDVYCPNCGSALERQAAPVPGVQNGTSR